MTACVVLHNLCENNGDCFHEEWLEGVTSQGDNFNYPDRGASIGKTKRDALANVLFINR